VIWQTIKLETSILTREHPPPRREFARKSLNVESKLQTELENTNFNKVVAHTPNIEVATRTFEFKSKILLNVEN
jgi:hypothetical protein